jgi:hypothetical protein
MEDRVIGNQGIQCRRITVADDLVPGIQGCCHI